MGNNTLPQTVHYVERQFNQHPIRQRDEDGYFDATAMCKATDKLFKDYRRLQSTQEFLAALSNSEGFPIDIAVRRNLPTEQNQGLIQITQGGDPQNQGTWVHPYVAVNLAQWCSAEFAVQVSKWVFELMSTGQVTLDNTVEKPDLPSPSRQQFANLAYEFFKQRTELAELAYYRHKGLTHDEIRKIMRFTHRELKEAVQTLKTVGLTEQNVATARATHKASFWKQLESDHDKEFCCLARYWFGERPDLERLAFYHYLELSTWDICELTNLTTEELDKAKQVLKKAGLLNKDVIVPYLQARIAVTSFWEQLGDQA